MNKTSSMGMVLVSVFGMISGCTKHAVFVTKSSISVVDVDSAPASISFAYDRTEGFLGPNYGNGAVPPVVGSIKTDGAIINPKIKQMYATGEAANIVIDDSVTSYATGQDSDVLTGKKKPLLFGTSTTFGFKIGISISNPSFTLGYKRKEVSFIPLRKKDDNSDEVYSSVIASIDTSLSEDSEGRSFENGQFFATGEAAKQLAAQKYIKDVFKERARSSLDIYDEQMGEQKQHHSDIARCSLNIVDSDKWNTVIAGGAASEIYGELDDLNQALTKYKSTNAAQDRIELIRVHSEAVFGGMNGESREHSILLKAYEKLICGQSGRT